MTRFANNLSWLVNRRVIDKKGAKGLYDVAITQPLPKSQGDRRQETTTTLAKGLEEQLGLKLESTPTLVELLVIDSAARPSEN